MNVLVTGATGAVGPGVVWALCEAGHTVRSFSLDRTLPGAFPANVDAQIGDVTDPAAVQSAMQGVDAVVQLAALRRRCPSCLNAFLKQCFNKIQFIVDNHLLRWHYSRYEYQ
jgi:nucleoside-diphosphate-sugar epimerase